MTDKIISKVENGIGWLIFNNAEKRNAVNLAMAAKVAEVLNGYADNPDVRVVVLRGEGGKSFVAGMDISEFEERRSSPELIKEYESISNGMYTSIKECPKATIAMIEGFCMGGGVAVACGCDFRICRDDSVFAVPAARLGIAYRSHFTRWVLEAVGPSTAKEILMTARRYDAANAHRLGLVNHVVSADDIEAFVLDYAATIADNAPLSVMAAKETVNQVSKSYGDWDPAICEAWQEKCSGSEDYKEGRRAFMEKRKPEFKGV
jgi:enoyl-CoA hydratase